MFYPRLLSFLTHKVERGKIIQKKLNPVHSRRAMGQSGLVPAELDSSSRERRAFGNQIKKVQIRYGVLRFWKYKNIYIYNLKNHFFLYI